MTDPIQLWPLRVIAMPESEAGQRAASRSPGFLLLGATRDDVLKRLPAALDGHCGRHVEFEIINSGGKVK